MTAARSLDVEIVRGSDIPDGLRETWDVPLALDFTNGETALRHLVDYCRAQPVDAMVALDDNATLLATRAAAALGLPHNPLEAAEAARDKGLMRERFAAYSVPSPVFQRVSLASDPQEIAGQVRYPCVVKPLRLNGSKGVIRADDPLTFVAAFTRLRRILVGDGYPLDRTEILVEDYLPGGEVALEGLLTDGQLHVLALFDKPDPLEGPFFEETIYVTPSRLPADVQDAIADCAARAAAALGLREGPLHAELRVNERGPWMLESAGRSIGGLCSTVVEFGSGMCLEELILRHAIGEEITAVERDGRAAGVMMIPIPSAGMLKGVRGVEEALEVPLITGVEITAKLNYALVPLPEGASYLGFIFARGDTPAQVEEAIRSAHKLLKFDIRREIAVLNAV